LLTIAATVTAPTNPTTPTAAIAAKGTGMSSPQRVQNPLHRINR
jgi:hypothetical protein